MVIFYTDEKSWVKRVKECTNQLSNLNAECSDLIFPHDFLYCVENK